MPVRGLLSIAALASVLLALSAPVALSAPAAGCRPATNVEAIVDDSLSMEMSDPDRLRAAGLDLLLATLPPRTRLGAIEFGSDFGELRPPADQVFAPAPIGPNAEAMEAALGEKLGADNGTTDYNGAFALADAENPGAQARIFITDGGQSEGEYANGHLAHNVPTYVIGFGPGLSGFEDRSRLRQIADETGGRYYRLGSSAQLQAALNLVGSQLSCDAPPRTVRDRLTEEGTASRAVRVGGATRSLRIALTWASPRDRFRLSGVRLVPLRGGAKARPLRIERRGNATFLLAEVTGLRPGYLRFSVTAARLRSDVRRPTVTIQVTHGG